MKVRTISVVTPCWNAKALIRETVESIVTQSAVRSGRVALEYIVCDGGSTDGTVDVVRETAGSQVAIISEPDAGMYDALAKGLLKASGEVVAYLNAGDRYFPNAFDVVADVMESGRAKWLTGLKTLLNERGQVTRVSTPYRYRRALIRRGVYGRVLPFIQQESTFWSRDLNGSLDLGRLAEFRLAGDYYLWRCFASQAELVVVESQLGAFLVHPGQQSEAIGAYFAEVKKLCGPAGPVALVASLIDAPLWLAPSHIKRRLSGKTFVSWSSRDARWT